MKTQRRSRSWLRLLLWSHVFSILAFYLVVWFRTNPRNSKPPVAKEHRGNPRSKRSPEVSVIVPARNEQRNIRRCVTSLLEQDYHSFEVIVVDDGSTDETPYILDEIAHQHPHGDRLWVLRLKDLPSGWAGKPHAIHSGVQEAHGTWLLFTDADTWHAPDALSTALARAQAEGIDLYTLGSKQELPGFWNKVMMPFAYLGISMQYPVYKVNDPDSPIAIANGQFILIRRAVYDLVGGYARPDLRGTLLDDLELARVVKANGFRLLFEDGSDLVHVYMYSTLRETWRGWRKNSFLGSRGGVPFALLELVGLPMVAVVPFVLPLVGLLTQRNGGKSKQDKQAVTPGEWQLAGTLEMAAVLTYRRWLDGKLSVPWYYGFTHPLAGALFMGILGQSIWRVLTHKGVDWSGRTYYSAVEEPTRADKSAVGTINRPLRKLP